MYFGLHKDKHTNAIFAGLAVSMPVMFFVLYQQLFGPQVVRGILTLFAGPSICAILNFFIVWIVGCCNREEYVPAVTPYTELLATRFQDYRLTAEKITEIMAGTVEPNGYILAIALMLLPLCVPFYSWDAQIGIFPGWALMSFGMIVLCTVVIFMAACSWKPMDNVDGAEDERNAPIELMKLGSKLHIDQNRGGGM